MTGLHHCIDTHRPESSINPQTKLFILTVCSHTQKPLDELGKLSPKLVFPQTTSCLQLSSPAVLNSVLHINLLCKQLTNARGKKENVIKINPGITTVSEPGKTGV